MWKEMKGATRNTGKTEKAYKQEKGGEKGRSTGLSKEVGGWGGGEGGGADLVAEGVHHAADVVEGVHCLCHPLVHLLVPPHADTQRTPGGGGGEEEVDNNSTQQNDTNNNKSNNNKNYYCFTVKDTHQKDNNPDTEERATSGYAGPPINLTWPCFHLTVKTFLKVLTLQKKVYGKVKTAK